MNRLNKIVAITSIALFMSACSSSPKPTWYKQGVTPTVTADKLGFCRTDVNAENLSEAHAKKMIAYCMKADGYKFGIKPRN
ncbi:hypothetical protein [Psychrobacter sp. BF1]|jgi:PBP1b-binding outer membrane lipoprotein LpoB|uniref:hypothetical protein n=1 Tax=Psychrobacter sp. BF1 TaxID=2821147 RepID=UPI001C4E2699|nr:hypothetical protein [Psychrobacter sp. BF1]MBR5494152.1 hypothetical protein [Psychrobacter sp.]